MIDSAVCGLSIDEALHEAGESYYEGDNHVYISLDSTVGVALTQEVGDATSSGFTNPTAIHVLPPGATSRWRHDRAIRSVGLRIGLATWKRATGSDPARLQPLPCRVDPTSSTLIRLLFDAAKNYDSVSEAYFSRLFQTMALSVEAGSRHVAPSAPNRADLLAVQRYIDDHIMEPLSVSDLAKVAGLTQRRFERDFATDMGLSPYRYVVEARLDRAGQLLAAGSLTIAEVARSSGFFDQAHVTRSMKRHRGITPATLRPPTGEFVQEG